MAFKVKKRENEPHTSYKQDSVSLVSLFVLVHRTCASFLEKEENPEEFYAYIDGFIKNKLKNPIHKSIFTFTVDRFKKMDFDKVKQECTEIPKRVAEKDQATYRLLVGYDINYMTH